ncbi:DUF2141 domain-containing protein [Variovorax sp. J22G21]|uniref:DUF2141 domain-containing protein n=1 Tax=Variovorax fucosicus TaxID=3053517 RepID=UPI002575C1BB|nr:MULTISPECIES: DUF2141 domain-containing protein [unclassified Variovorax]MDM0038724.1 DUF2141 domain-containing protein [Variovorax sp. J22R193]MDM0063500.1 DUF2141 domain-containing protein [Variovorax sp. J22G21]
MYSFQTLCAAALLAPLAASAADLRVAVADGPAVPATLYVALYDSADAYAGGKSVASQTLPVRAGNAQLAFLGLPAGRYVLRLFADENGNGKLDANLLGLPIERYGFSNDAKGKMGPPTFDAASFPLEADTTTTVHLR